MSLPTVRIPLQRGVRAAACVGIAHALALVAALVLPDVAAAIVVAGILLSAFTFAVPLVRAKARILDGLELGADGTVRGIHSNGDEVSLELRGFRILAPDCVVVSMRSSVPRDSITLLLLAGDQTEDALRQLRLWLRWRSEKGRGT